MRTRSWLPYALFAAALLLTLGATFSVAASARQRDSARFLNNVQAATDRVSSRLDTYVAVLRAGAALFAASDTVDAERWRTFVERLDVQERYPGVQGIGFSRRMSAEELPGLIAELRRQVHPEFSVRPDGPRDEYHSIVYLEPLDRRNLAALGFDMFTEPTRRAAMERARDNAEPALSGRVRLMQEIDEHTQAGFLIYLPVYRTPEIPPTVEERRAELRGFVYTPFRADDLFAGIFGTEKSPRVYFRVYDGPEPRPDRLLHASHPDAGLDSGDLLETVRLSVEGHTWTLLFTPSTEFLQGSRTFVAPLVASSGILMSLLLFLVLSVQGRAREAAERSRLQAERLAAELRARAAEAEEARAAAEEANRAKSEFLATMSHELRTPLNAIGGYAELMELGIRGALTPEQEQDLQKIKRAQQHLLRQINDILNFAKLEAGKVEFRLEELEVDEVLAELDELIVPLAEKKSIRYRRLPAGPGVRVMADRQKLQQIILNLLSNAVKFTRPEGEVELSSVVDERTVEIRVRDTGIGIPADRLQAIFDPFVQLDTGLTRSTEGTGLGLAISRELASSMGAGISVASEPEGGSEFSVRLERVGSA